MNVLLEETNNAISAAFFTVPEVDFISDTIFLALSSVLLLISLSSLIDIPILSAIFFNFRVI
tara:strand:- start:477 stop:662 length:186 start_codon:yes stop_codon:yes gene_type:complete